jgi:hypothetical protein
MSDPMCHGASSPQLGQTPRGCGHDHNNSVTTLTASATPTAPTLTSLLATVASHTPGDIAVAGLPASYASPPHDPLSRQLSVALRI